MSKGKAVLAVVTVIIGAIMSAAPPLAAWYTRKTQRKLPKVLRPAKEGKVPRKVIEEAVRKVREERENDGEA